MKNIIYRALLLITAITAFSSCLKDDSVVLDPSKGNNVIEFANPGSPVAIGTPFALYSFAYETTITPTVPITISYSGPELTAPRDITVKFTVGDTTQINPYNRATNSRYVPLNAASYSLSTNEVVIKAGTSKASFNIIFKPSSFNFSAAEVLPLKITEVSSGTLSGNYNTILLNVSAKNPYDGIYTYYATHIASDRPTFLTGTEFKYPSDVQLRTSGATTNNLWNAAFGDFLIPLITSTGGTSGFGQTNLLLQFDPTTNKVISASNAITAATNGRKMNLDLTANNYFDPATRNIFVTYFMTQPGFSPFKIIARLEYKGPRP